MEKRICIGNDHAGTELKKVIQTYLENLGWVVINKGTDDLNSVDYPDYAHPVAACVENEESRFGILICGSANGVCMSANKHSDIRAALCWKPEIAALARAHNDANILCLPARYLTNEEAKDVLIAFLNTDFEGGRHRNRVNKIACS